MINAIGGLFGTGLAAFIAVKSGKAETYFVPKLLQQLGLFVIFAGSVVIRRPLTGYIIAPFYRADPDWVKLPPVKRVMTEFTLVWAALFAFRAGVYGILIATGRVGGARGGLDRDGLARVRRAALLRVPLRAEAARAARRARPAARRARRARTAP